VTQDAEAPIDLVDYDPAWPVRFEEERRLLSDVLATWLAGPIEHVGSTAVPGLCAKPVIDIMAPVHTLEGSRPALDAAATLRYVYFPYRPTVMHWFCKPSPAVRTHHLHLVPVRSPLWVERLTFRDYLRQEPRVAEAYARLKTDLAQQYRHDREGYTEAKGPFVAQALAAAHARAPRQDPAL